MFRIVATLSLVALLLSACSTAASPKDEPKEEAQEAKQEVFVKSIPALEGLNQDPIPLKLSVTEKTFM